MTRRKIYYFDKKTEKLYSTPEFNGDKSEFNLFSKRGDSCDKDFDEILKEFDNIKTLEEFKNASNKAQSYYHSGFVGTEILPIEEVSEITYNDEIYTIDINGNPYLYNPSELTREYVRDMCDRGKFVCKDLTMSVTKYKHLKNGYDVYMLNIAPIENVYSGLELCLGDFSNDEKNKYWGYEFNKNLDLLIGKLEKCKENLNKEPLKVELIDLFNNEYKCCFKDEKGNVYGLSNGGDCIFLTTLDKKRNVENRLYDFIEPILWDKTDIYAIYLSSHDGIGYEKKYFDIPRIEMAYKLNSYMTIKEDVLYSETINKNLNNIYADVYNRESIEEYFFRKYENENDIQELKNEYYKLLNDTMGLNIELEERGRRNMTKENIIDYSKKFFELLSNKFENNISYRYKLLFLKNEKYNQYSVNLAIDTDNSGNKNKIAYFTYKNFGKLDREKQLEYMGNFYNAEIVGKNENEFTIENAEKDFLQICDFNYLRDKKKTEEKEEESV